MTGFDDIELETFSYVEDLNLINETLDEIEIKEEDEDINNILVTEKDIIYTLVFDTEEEYNLWNEFLKLNVDDLPISQYLILELNKYV